MTELEAAEKSLDIECVITHNGQQWGRLDYFTMLIEQRDNRIEELERDLRHTKKNADHFAKGAKDVVKKRDQLIIELRERLQSES